MNRIGVFGLASGMLLAVLGGCGGSDGGVQRLTVYPVKGTVLLASGKPLSGGKVYFVPTDGAVTAEGKVASDGTFALETGGSGEGWARRRSFRFATRPVPRRAC